MSNKCCKYEEAIWEHARTGAALSGEATRHIESCPECAMALREARQLTGIMLSDDCVPPAPDCRSAVMPRIAPPQRTFRFTWTYACAAVLVAAIGLAYVLHPRFAPNLSVQVAYSNHESTKERKHEISGEWKVESGGPGRELSALRAGVQKHDVRVPVRARYPISPETEPRDLRTPTRTAHHHLPRWSRPVRIAANRVPATSTADPANTEVAAVPSDLDMAKLDRQPAPPPASPEPSNHQTIKPSDQPVAIAVVTWPSAADLPDNYDYSYTERDPITGATTKCSVKREGNSVEINMEVEPEVEKAPPVRGSVDYEPKPNA